jgi:hypothetical protein
MNRSRLEEKLLVAVVAVAGCSSGVELDVEREEARTAAHTEVPSGLVSATATRTRVRLVAQQSPNAPTPAAERHPPPAPASSYSAESRPVPAPITPPPVVTNIRVGDINIHVGDIVHVHGGLRVGDDGEPPVAATSAHPCEVRPQSHSTPETPPPETDPRCDRLAREHEARLRRWEALFRR